MPIQLTQQSYSLWQGQVIARYVDLPQSIRK